MTTVSTTAPQKCRLVFLLLFLCIFSYFFQKVGNSPALLSMGIGALSLLGVLLSIPLGILRNRKLQASLLFILVAPLIFIGLQSLLQLHTYTHHSVIFGFLFPSCLPLLSLVHRNHALTVASTVVAISISIHFLYKLDAAIHWHIISIIPIFFITVLSDLLSKRRAKAQHTQQDLPTGFNLQAAFLMDEAPSQPGHWYAPLADSIDLQESDFTIDCLIARGGMGAVYAGHHKKEKTKVAIKLLPQNEDAEQSTPLRFQREMTSLSLLDHPSIVKFHQSGMTQDGEAFFVMEFANGEPLNQLIKEQPFSEKEIIHIMLQLCDAVRYAHQNGIIHRDLKPANLIYDGKHLKVVDFGLSSLQPEHHSASMDPYTLTHTGAKFGTFLYMSPEQLDGKAITPLSDIYSIGIILYELLTQTTPKGAYSPPSEITEHSVEFDAIIHKTLQPNPEKRYQNLDELISDLKSLSV